MDYNLNKWVICKCPKCNKHSLYYVDDNIPEGENKFKYSGYEDDDLICVDCNEKQIEITQKEWTTNDYSEIIGNELENANRHKQVDIPSRLLSILNLVDSLSEEDKKFIMNAFGETLFKPYRESWR